MPTYHSRSSMPSKLVPVHCLLSEGKVILVMFREGIGCRLNKWIDSEKRQIFTRLNESRGYIMVCSCHVGLSVLDLISACHSVWDDVSVQTNQMTLTEALEHRSVVQIHWELVFPHHCCSSYCTLFFFCTVWWELPQARTLPWVMWEHFWIISPYYRSILREEGMCIHTSYKSLGVNLVDGSKRVENLQL